MAKVSEVATEAVAEAAEEVAEQAEVVAEVARRLSPREIRLTSSGLGLGLVVGIAVGGLYVNRRLRLKYEEIAEDEIAQMREHFRAKEIARQEKPDVQELEDEVARAGYTAPSDETNKVTEGGETLAVRPATPAEEPVGEVEGSPSEVVDPPTGEVSNVFEEHGDDAQTPRVVVDNWDYDEELAKREANPGKPYVIHKDEQGEQGYNETTLTYYAGDDVLADPNDNVVNNVEEILGADFVDKFGHGSDDPNVVYIRNDSAGADFEVVRSDGKYSHEVAGLTHSDESVGFMRRRTSTRDE
jgi:hypothetical protein